MFEHRQRRSEEQGELQTFAVKERSKCNGCSHLVKQDNTYNQSDWKWEMSIHPNAIFGKGNKFEFEK